MQGEKTQPGKLFLHDLHVGYLMGIKFSINSDMEEIAHFLIFLKSHQMRELHMVLEKKKKWSTASDPQDIMVTATPLVSRPTVTFKVI